MVRQYQRIGKTGKYWKLGLGAVLAGNWKIVKFLTKVRRSEIGSERDC